MSSDATVPADPFGSDLRRCDVMRYAAAGLVANINEGLAADMR